MNAHIRVRGVPGDGTPVSEMILGHNIETALTTVPGLLADRLRNPKFVGPPHAMTGVAPEWQGASCGRAAYELTPTGGLRGREAQLIRAGSEPATPALHQNRIPIRRGEELELELWARAWHEPVEIEVALRPLANTLEPYAAATIVVDRSWYSRYSVVFAVPRDDDHARLSVSLRKGGELWIDQIHLRPVGEPLLCRRIVDEMRSMRIPTLRFPGGIVANAYDWKHGTGPEHLRPAMLEAAFHQPWYLNYDFGIDELLEVCRDQGIAPAITLNIATGTPDDAAELARYCADWYRSHRVELPLVYWHIGNHPYHYTTAHMTAAMYSEVLDRFIPPLREHYPAGRIVAVMSRADLSAPAGKAPWRDAILAKGSLIDVVEVQTYGLLGARPADPGEYEGGIADPQKQTERVVAVIADVERAFTAFAETLESRRIDMRMGVAEWNWWMQASHWDENDFEEPPLTLHGLYTAGLINAFARLSPRFEVAHFYNLVNCMGILNHRGADVEVTPSVEIFRLYRPALPGKRVDVAIEAPPFGEAKKIDALCLENDGGRWLYLVNFDPAEAADIDVTGGGTPQTAVEMRCLAGGATTAALTVTTASATTTGDGLRVTVPPLSITRCRLR